MAPGIVSVSNFFNLVAENRSFDALTATALGNQVSITMSEEGPDVGPSVFSYKTQFAPLIRSIHDTPASALTDEPWESI